MKYKDINLKVRAFNPFPGAWTKISGDNKRIKILKSEVVKKMIPKRNLVVGNVSDSLEIKCGKGFLKILKLQIEGKKILSGKEFLNGYKKKDLTFE